MEREIQEEVVIDLAELIALYLRKGFWIIGISLLFAGAFVKFRAMPEEETSKKDGNVEEATLQDKDLKEEKALEEKGLTANERYYTAQIKKEKERLLWEQDNWENSYLFTLDPDKVYERQIDLYVKVLDSGNISFTEDSGEKIGDRAENAERAALTENYSSLFQSGSFYESIAVAQGSMKASDVADILFFRSNDEAGTLSLCFTGASEEDVQKMGDAAAEYWLNAENGMQENVAMHDLHLVNDKTTLGMTTHSVNRNALIKEDELTDSMESSILLRQNEKKDSINTRIRTISDLEKAKKELPKAVNNATQSYKKIILKQAVLGLFLGGFLSVFLFTLQYLLEAKLPKEEDLESLYGFTVLGSKKRYGRKGILPSLSEKLSGDKEREKDDENLLSLAKTNLSLLLREKQTGTDILFVGEDKQLCEKTEDFMACDHSQFNCSYAYNIFKNEESIERLGAAQNIVFVAKGKSELRAILNMKRRCEKLGKSIAGLILY